jgi:hypothetical protein
MAAAHCIWRLYGYADGRLDGLHADHVVCVDRKKVGEWKWNVGSS